MFVFASYNKWYKHGKITMKVACWCGAFIMLKSRRHALKAIRGNAQRERERERTVVEQTRMKEIVVNGAIHRE